MAVTQLSQKEYLKKYLSNPDEKKRKKKKTVKCAQERFRVVDDDIDLKNMRPLEEGELDLYNLAEDAPQIAGIVDERPEEMITLEEFRGTKRWKIMSDENGVNDLKVTAIGNSEKQVKNKEITQGTSSKSRRDSDASPPRRSNSDYSPPRKSNDRDQSPPRKSRKSDVTDSPPTRKYKHNLNVSSRDSSPARRKKHEADLSPPRKRNNKHPSDLSPPRKMKRSDNSDQSPPRNSRKQDKRVCNSDSDASPPRKTTHTRRRSPSPAKKVRMEKTLDGKKAGLQDARQLKDEISNFRKKEDEVFAQMGDEVSGRGAAAVMRDRKTGKRRNLEEEGKQKEEEEKKLAVHKEKYSKWGKGLKQVEEQKENLQQALHEMSKPLARYADDQDLEQHLRDQEREGDPMLDYIRSKKPEDYKKNKPRYQGSFLPNRFGIPPGHRWDGVDRSNGYEKQWFEHQNSKKAVEEEAYKWSTSDM